MFPPGGDLRMRVGCPAHQDYGVEKFYKAQEIGETKRVSPSRIPAVRGGLAETGGPFFTAKNSRTILYRVVLPGVFCSGN